MTYPDADPATALCPSEADQVPIGNCLGEIRRRDAALMIAAMAGSLGSPEIEYCAKLSGPALERPCNPAKPRRPWRSA